MSSVSKLPAQNWGSEINYVIHNFILFCELTAMCSDILYHHLDLVFIGLLLHLHIGFIAPQKWVEN